MHMPLQIMMLMLEALRHAHALRELWWAKHQSKHHNKPARNGTLLLALS